MSGSAKQLSLRSSEGIYWAVEETCTLVVNEKRGEAFRLAGIPQAVWDCLQLGYTIERVRQMVCVLGKMEPEAAEREVRAILREWQMLGLVEGEEKTRG